MMRQVSRILAPVTSSGSSASPADMMSCWRPTGCGSSGCRSRRIRRCSFCRTGSVAESVTQRERSRCRLGGGSGMAEEYPDQFGLRDQPRWQVELSAVPGNANFQSQGAARAELVRRDREYAEEQERSRRAYEDQRDATRRDFEREMFNAEGDRDVKRKQFEAALAERQMAHATALATDQVSAAQSAARAARLAAWATAVAAAGAVAQAVIAALK
jgi:hypothetical protein